MQTELTQLKLRASFRTQQLSEKDFLSYEHLLLAMSKLAGSQFDEETFEQLWDECTLNSSGEARIGEFISHLLSAEKILVEKIRTLQGERKRWETAGKDRSIEYSQVRNIEQQLSHVEEELGLLMESLIIIRHPFSRQAVVPQTAYQKDRESGVESGIEEDKGEDPEILQWILYLSLLLLGVGWVGSLLLNRFLEQTMCGFILGSLLLETVSKKTLRVSMWICLLSIALDVVWLGLYMTKIWYPALNYQLPRLVSSYLQLSITLTLIILLLKAVLAYLHFAIDFQQLQIYRLRFFSHSLILEKRIDPLSANENPLIFGLMSTRRLESDSAF